MEHVPLDVPNGGQRCEYYDINAHVVVMLEIPWLHTVVDGSTLPHGSLILNPMWNPFSLPKHTPQPPPNHHLWHWQWPKTSHNISGHKQIDPLNIGPLGEPLVRRTWHHGKHDDIALSKVGSSYIGKKGHCWLGDIGYFCWYQLGQQRDQDRKENAINTRRLEIQKVVMFINANILAVFIHSNQLVEFKVRQMMQVF